MAGAEDRAAAGGEHDVGRVDELGERGLLAIAEGGLALDLEDGRDGHAERALQLVVGVDEALVEPAGELPPERGFARAHESDEKQIARVQLHRGIVVESRARRARRAPAARSITRAPDRVHRSLTMRGVMKISNSLLDRRPVVLEEPAEDREVAEARHLGDVVGDRSS